MSTPEPLDETAALSAIDVHGHYGPYVREERPVFNFMMSGTAELVAERARRANIQWTVVSPLLALVPRFKADATAGNRDAFETVPRTGGLLQWVVVNPLQPETYAQAETMLAHPRCMGIKIHPEEHGYAIRERGREIFSFAARLRAVILTHSGEANSLPDDFVPFADAYPEATLILAHLGSGPQGTPDLQVRAVQKSSHGNVYVDTSSASSIWSGLLERSVGEIGSDRILFGTDTPLYSTASQRARVDHAEISVFAKRQILAENARRILRIP